MVMVVVVMVVMVVVMVKGHYKLHSCHCTFFQLFPSRLTIQFAILIPAAMYG